jgi:hypothetical protein
MEETRARNFPEDPYGIGRQPVSQLGTLLPLECSAGLQIVGTIQYPPHHVPLGESEGVVPDGIEDAAIVLAFGTGPRRAGWTVAQLGWTRAIVGPPGQLLWRGVAQGIVKPDRPQPPVALRIGHPELLGPGRRQTGYPMDVLQSLRRDHRPFRQCRPELSINQGLEPD